MVNGETKYTGLLKLQIDIDGLREMSFVPALQTGYTTQYLDAEEEQMELFGFLENFVSECRDRSNRSDSGKMIMLP